MYRLLQKHGKKLMAVFSAVLMIAFALPSFRGGGGGAGVQVVGRAGGDKILQQDVYRARQAWQLLSQLRINPNRPESSVADVLGPTAVQQINRKPVLFYLLQKEAQKMGISMNVDQLKGIIENTPALKSGNADKDEDIQNALGQLLLVRQAFVRAAGAIKVSQPMRDYALGTQAQSITLAAADFTSAQYASKVPAPTADQLKSQFEKYANIIKGTPFGDNPFGFGYKYPDRIKLQYIAVPRADVRKFVEGFTAPGKAKDPYEWEVDAQKYYRQHPSEFPTTQPAEAPKNSSFSLESSPSRSTTKPYSEVATQIRKKLIDEATDRRLAQIRERITSTLASDYVTYKNAVGATTNPTTVPASSLRVPYNSFEYLQKLAAEIQSAYGVLPAIQSIADKWQTGEDLAKLPPFGQAVVMGLQRPVTAPLYLMAYTSAFVPEANRNETGILHLFEPSRPLEDSYNTIYIARVTGAEPAHKPPTLAEVEKQVSEDLNRKAAYDLAKADAEKLLDEARKSGLKTAAGSRSLLTVGPLTVQNQQPIVGISVSPPLTDYFLSQAFKLITTPTSRPSGKPDGLIELQPDGRLLVAELSDVQAMWNDRSRGMEESIMAMQLKNELDQRFGTEWFQYDSVASRLNYVPEKTTGEDDNAPPQQSEPMQPIF